MGACVTSKEKPTIQQVVYVPESSDKQDIFEQKDDFQCTKQAQSLPPLHYSSQLKVKGRSKVVRYPSHSGNKILTYQVQQDTGIQAIKINILKTDNDCEATNVGEKVKDAVQQNLKCEDEVNPQNTLCSNRASKDRFLFESIDLCEIFEKQME